MRLIALCLISTALSAHARSADSPSSAAGLRSAYCRQALTGADARLRHGLVAGILRANLMVPQAEIYIQLFAFAAYLGNPIPAENLDLRITTAELEPIEMAMKGAHAAHEVFVFPTRNEIRTLEHKIFKELYSLLIDFGSHLDPSLRRSDFRDNAFTRMSFTPVALPGVREQNARMLNAVLMEPSRRPSLVSWGQRLRTGLLDPKVRDAARAYREAVKEAQIAKNANQPPRRSAIRDSLEELSIVLRQAILEQLNQPEDRVIRRFLLGMGV